MILSSLSAPLELSGQGDEALVNFSGTKRSPSEQIYSVICSNELLSGFSGRLADAAVPANILVSRSRSVMDPDPVFYSYFPVFTLIYTALDAIKPRRFPFISIFDIFAF